MTKSHIDVSTVLRQTVSQSYTNLVTRSTGVAVRAYIEEQILQPDCGSVAVIDFTHVGMMDFSCADEIVAKLVLHADERTPKLVFSGLSESHLEAIDVVLERHGRALAPLEGDQRTYVAVFTH